MYSATFTPREYQEKIFNVAKDNNTLIVLPTGLGKTNIFVLLALHRLNLFPNKKILLLGPTRPLIEQYFEVFKKNTNVDENDLVVLTGRIKPEKRKVLFENAKIIFSTPQGLENDILTGRLSFKDVSLIGFDEAHRATGDYSYVWLAKKYIEQASFQRIVGLTASPGSEKEKIEEILKNLFIEKVELRTHDDVDVKKYVKPVKIIYEYVSIPENLKEVIKLLKDSFKEKVKLAGEYLGEPSTVNLTKTDLLKLQAELRNSIIKGNSEYQVKKALSILAEAMKVQHAIELAESQGVFALKEYFEQLFHEAKTTKVQATKNLVSDDNFRNAFVKTLSLVEKKTFHPKLLKLLEIVKNSFVIDKESKILIFNNYRDNASVLVEELNKIPNVKAALFVGQAKKKNSGLNQKEQKLLLEKFSKNEFNVLVSTSIGEEGLDIPKVDTVIFYEPVPSAIRSIQRRGRTGRNEKGRVIILIAKNTRDEAYLWSTRHKEKKMYNHLKEINKTLFNLKNNNVSVNKSLEEYNKISEDIVIFVDSREKNNPVVKELSNLGVNIKMELLESADFVLSSDVGVEFKTAEDFVNSIVDGRLLSQAKSLKQNYSKPLMLIEGYENIYNIRNLHPNAIRGAVSSIAVDFGITLIPSKNVKDSAGILLNIARREQLKNNRPLQKHFEKPKNSLSEIQEYLISSIPGFGSVLSKPLLKEFKTIKNIANSSVKDFEKIEKIGSKKAKLLYDVFNKEYEE